MNRDDQSVMAAVEQAGEASQGMVASGPAPVRTRVLFVIPAFREGGAERVFLTLLRRLDRASFDLHLAILQTEGLASADLPADVQVHNLRTARVRSSLPRLIRTVWALRPDVLVSTLGHMNMAVLLARAVFPRGTKVIVREATTLSAALGSAKGLPRWWIWLYRLLYRRADLIICPSDAMVRDLAAVLALPRQKLMRIYNPLDAAALARLAAAAPRSFATPGPHLVAVGRLEREKGFDLLLKAMPQVRERYPSAELTILGSGSLEPELRSLVSRLHLDSCVHLAGFRPNPYPFFRDADLFVLSSRVEGLPNAMLEALAMGVPVVATGCQGVVRELVHENRGCCWIAESADVGDLAHAILDALAATLGNRSAGAAWRMPAELQLDTVLRQYAAAVSSGAARQSLPAPDSVSH